MCTVSGVQIMQNSLHRRMDHLESYPGEEVRATTQDARGAIDRLLADVRAVHPEMFAPSILHINI